MEDTCIDGAPNLRHKFRVFYLKNFKRYIVESVEQSSNISKLAKCILKYVFTIGLSGFLILLITMFKDNIETRQTDTQRQESMDVSKETLKEINAIFRQIERIDQSVIEIVQALQSQANNSRSDSEENENPEIQGRDTK